MKRRLGRFWRYLAITIAAFSFYSLMPLLAMYVQKDPPVRTNEQAIERLKGNVGASHSFIVFGDNHAGLFLSDSAALKIIARMNREGRFGKLPVDFIISPGDVTFRASVWDYRNWNKIRSRAKYPVISAMGNHDDDRDEEAVRFKKYNGEREFAFANRDSFFIVLDNSGGDLSDGQLEWFEAELKRSSAYAHRFVVLHKPPISPYQQSWYRPELLPWAGAFMKLCEKYGVDIVFSGHEHMSKVAEYGGVLYVTTGGGGMITQVPGWDGGFLHYVVVRVCGGYVDLEVRKVFPPLWEFFTYYMWKDIFYFLKDALF